MTDVKLGQLAPENSERDAIHIAVAPVIAAEKLAPGEWVNLDPDGRAIRALSKKDGIGVADPFLTKTIRAGETFWLCLYQNTVTGMKHHWSHPAFPLNNSIIEESVKRNKHEVWIRGYAENLGIGYEELMSAANNWVDYENMTLNNYMEGTWISDEFWVHYEGLTGKKGEGSFFTCSC